MGGNSKVIESGGLSSAGTQLLLDTPLSSGPCPVIMEHQFGALTEGIWSRALVVAAPSLKNLAKLGKKEVAFSKYIPPVKTQVEKKNQ